MASLKDMRVRIASTKATQKITKAMQMVAASKLRRAQTAAEGNALSGLEKLKTYQTRRSASTDPDRQNGNADFRSIAPGATQVIADLEGPGVITHLWNTVAAKDIGYARLLRLRMYWDGETQPSTQE